MAALKKTEIIWGSTQNHHYIVASLSFMIFFPSLQPFFFGSVRESTKARVTTRHTLIFAAQQGQDKN